MTFGGASRMCFGKSKLFFADQVSGSLILCRYCVHGNGQGEHHQ